MVLPRPTLAPSTSSLQITLENQINQAVSLFGTSIALVPCIPNSKTPLPGTSLKKLRTKELIYSAKEINNLYIEYYERNPGISHKAFNIGIMPLDNLVIIDLDVRKGIIKNRKSRTDKALKNKNNIDHLCQEIPDYIKENYSEQIQDFVRYPISENEFSRYVNNFIKDFLMITSIDLKTTTCVSTPNGYHFYLKWPKGKPVPTMGALDKIFYRQYLGDLRTSSSIGYCLIPRSNIDYPYSTNNTYEFITFNNEASIHPPLCINDDQFNKFFDQMKKRSHELDSDKRWANKQTKNSSTKISRNNTCKKNDVVKNNSINQLSSNDKIVINNTQGLLLHSRSIADLRKLLKNNYKNASFHSRRSAVYKAVSCCLDMSSIIDLWRQLNLDHDSSKGVSHHLSDKDLCRDFNRLFLLEKKNDSSSFHGPYCFIGKKTHHNYLKKDNKFNLLDSHVNLNEKGEFLTKNALNTPRGYYYPQVLFYPRLIRSLKGTKLGNYNNRQSKYADLALTIMTEIVGSWLSLGQSTFYMTTHDLMNRFNVSESEIRGAKRLLINHGILEIASMPHSSGLSTRFRVNSSYIDQYVSTLLRGIAYERKEDFFYINYNKSEICSVIDSSWKKNFTNWDNTINNQEWWSIWGYQSFEGKNQILYLYENNKIVFPEEHIKKARDYRLSIDYIERCKRAQEGLNYLKSLKCQNDKQLAIKIPYVDSEECKNTNSHKAFNIYKNYDVFFELNKIISFSPSIYHAIHVNDELMMETSYNDFNFFSHQLPIENNFHHVYIVSKFYRDYLLKKYDDLHIHYLKNGSFKEYICGSSRIVFSNFGTVSFVLEPP